MCVIYFFYIHFIFFCLFVKIQRKSKNSKKYIIGNIYRLPNEFVSDITIFNEDFAETLDILHTKITPTYLCGDFNIDLLKMHQKPNYCTFYDNLISSGYLPLISLPTRLTDHSDTIIVIFSVRFWMIISLV